jgi:hypothetical protein
MKNQIKNYGNIIALFLMLSSLISYAQVGIGTSPPNENSSLDLHEIPHIDIFEFRIMKSDLLTIKIPPSF